MTIKSRWTTPVPNCSLQEWIFGSATGAVADRVAFADPEDADTRFLTIDGYRLLSKRIALGLIDAGLKPGDRVLLSSPNNLFYPPMFLGVLMAGGIFTGASPAFVARELAYQLKDSAASFLIANESVLDTALEAAEEIGFQKGHIFVFDSDGPLSEDQSGPGAKGRQQGCRHWTELVTGNAKKAQAWEWVEVPDPAETTCCLNYSSGTTGVPKGVEISHRAYVANGEQVDFVSQLKPTYAQDRKRARGLCFLPLYHAFAQTYFTANFVKMGVHFYIMQGFDLEKMLEYIEKYRITVLTLVPPVVVALAKSPEARNYDLSSLEGLGSGAAPLSREVSDEVERMFPKKQDVLVRQGWGMTEVTCTCMAFDPRDRTRSAGVGEMQPNCAAKLMGLDGKTEIKKAKVPGELWVTGPTLMRGYWRKKAETEAVMAYDEDGTRWLRTGDVAYIDKYRVGGIFHVVDRLKELIKVRGRQVAPAELEALLLERKDIIDACVVGVTVQGEEVPRAYVVKDDDSETTEKDVAQWLAKRVASYKRLRGGVAFADYIPKNPVSQCLRAPSNSYVIEASDPIHPCQFSLVRSGIKLMRRKVRQDTATRATSASGPRTRR
jgi:4-coumarate--CoA ligase